MANEHIECMAAELRSLAPLLGKVEEYKEQEVDESIECHQTLEVICELREFDGSQSKYIAWREAAHNAMKLYKIGSIRYLEALTILRMKIVEAADLTVLEHNTPLNFKAIIARLDHAFLAIRSFQGNLSLVEYYDLVTQKLMLLTNKTIVALGVDMELTKQANEINRERALNIFISGLNQPLSNAIFSLKPADLPQALAMAQELEFNDLRTQFADQFRHNNKSLSGSKPQRNNYNNSHGNHNYKQNNNPNYRRLNYRNNGQNYNYKNNRNFDRTNAMDIDHSVQYSRQTQQRQTCFIPMNNFTPNINPGAMKKQAHGSGNQRINYIK